MPADNVIRLGARQAALRIYGRRLAAMVAQRNWSAIPGIDAEVQTLLNACIEAGGPDSLEMEALQQIRHAYENGIRSVSDSSAEIEKQIDALHARKEGWMAYAALAGLEERMK